VLKYLLINKQGLAGRVIAGIAIGGVASVLLLAACIYFGCYRKMKVEALFLSTKSEEQHGRGIYIFCSELFSPPLLFAFIDICQ
jgi:hypothetical protein